MWATCLVIIDPVSSYLGKVDSHKNAEVRTVLEPIVEMASRLRVAVVAVTHFSKGGGTSANHRIIGSIAFVAAARAAFIGRVIPTTRTDACSCLPRTTWGLIATVSHFALRPARSAKALLLRPYPGTASP
jgi:RecA-family ATPase